MVGTLAVVAAGFFAYSNRPLDVPVATIERDVPIRVFGLGTTEVRVLSKISFEVGATLTELRQSLMTAEAELTGGAGRRVSPSPAPNDAASLLQRAGFALPVADVDRVTVRYAHPLKLMGDLRQMGETQVAAERHPRKLTRAVLGRACEIYAERFGDPDGRVPATFELITLTGWAPHESQQKPLRPGSAQMRLADALGSVEHPLPRDDEASPHPHGRRRYDS